MDTVLSQNRNKVLDEVIAGRRSVLVFTSEIPPKELIQEIILAGLHARQLPVGKRFFTLDQVTAWL